MSQFYHLKAASSSGGTLDFDSLRGKVVLIVNVASKCGFTPQYKGIQSLYEKYKGQGLEVLGFPCNQFGGQEPGTDAEVAQFCERNYGVTFPLMKKSDVNGEHTNEVYKYLKGTDAGGLGGRSIKWNFEKFLLNGAGDVVRHYGSSTKPEEIERDIAALL